MFLFYSFIKSLTCVARTGLFNILDVNRDFMAGVDVKDNKIKFMTFEEIKSKKLPDSLYKQEKKIIVDDKYLNANPSCNEVHLRTPSSEGSDWWIFENQSNNEGKIYNVKCDKCVAHPDYNSKNYGMILIDCEDEKTKLFFQPVLVKTPVETNRQPIPVSSKTQPILITKQPRPPVRQMGASSLYSVNRPLISG